MPETPSQFPPPLGAPWTWDEESRVRVGREDSSYRLCPYTPEEISAILTEAGKDLPLREIQCAIQELGVLGWKAKEHSNPLVRFVYRLGRAANGYIVHRHDIEEAPRFTEVGAALNQIHARAGALLKTLDSLQEVAGAKVRAAAEELQKKTWNLLDTLLQMNGKTELACQLVLTRMVLERAPGREGKPLPTRVTPFCLRTSR